MRKRNKTLSKEIASKHLENGTLREAVDALKKKNSEGMKLLEKERDNYAALSAKEVETSLRKDKARNGESEISLWLR